MERLGDPLLFVGGFQETRPPLFRLPNYLLSFEDPPDPFEPPLPVEGLGLTGGFGDTRPFSEEEGLPSLCSLLDTLSPSG